MCKSVYEKKTGPSQNVKPTGEMTVESHLALSGVVLTFVGNLAVKYETYAAYETSCVPPEVGLQCVEICVIHMIIYSEIDLISKFFL